MYVRYIKDLYEIFRSLALLCVDQFLKKKCFCLLTFSSAINSELPKPIPKNEPIASFDAGKNPEF